MLLNGKEFCDCPKKKCVRHGNCKECMAHHGERPPRCEKGPKKPIDLFKK